MNIHAWKGWAKTLKQNLYALFLAYSDERVPTAAKILIGIVVAYALSPIDLIPDFIPVIGYLDDLILVPLGIWIVMRLIPKSVWNECQEQAAGKASSSLPRSRKAALVIVAVWITNSAGLAVWLWSQW